MADAGLWVGDTNLGKNCLFGDFPRKTDISRFYLLGRRVHEDATPMRRRARNMCRSVGRESLEMVGDILAGPRQDQGASAENGAKQNLKAPKASNIVKRAPNRRTFERADCCRQARHTVPDDLGWASQKHAPALQVLTRTRRSGGISAMRIHVHPYEAPEDCYQWKWKADQFQIGLGGARPIPPSRANPDRCLSAQPRPSVGATSCYAVPRPFRSQTPPWIYST
jgi:hypothetical protein